MSDNRCPRCGNSDERYFGRRGGKIYCRKCLSFNGADADPTFCGHSGNITLPFALSTKQKNIAYNLLENYKRGQNALLHAVTGAGKTELVYAVIQHCLDQGKHVGFAIPRVDIVLDLLPRFRQAFKSLEIVGVYGGHCEKLVGDIIILTTHQLYRYPQYFDLLILDEIDAFPYKDNSELQHFFRRSLRGLYILMSATATPAEYKAVRKDNGTIFLLPERYHQKPLPVPVFVAESIFPRVQVLLKLLSFYRQKKPTFIFVPTIAMAREVGNFLYFFLRRGTYVSSESADRKAIIERFKEGTYSYLVTTSILERGVTVQNLQVIVYAGHSKIYDEATLVQISGRVGRKINAEGGEVIVYGKRKTEAVKSAIGFIETCNRKAGL